MSQAMGGLQQGSNKASNLFLSELQGFGLADMQRGDTSLFVDNLLGNGGAQIWLGDGGSEIGFGGRGTIYGGDGYDCVHLLGGSSAALREVEEVIGSDGRDSVRMLSHSGEYALLGVQDVEALKGGDGFDVVQLMGTDDQNMAISGVEVFYGNAGWNEITLGNAGNDLYIADVQKIKGGIGWDRVQALDSNQGNDFNWMELEGVEEFQGSYNPDTLDIASLGDKGEILYASDVEYVFGGQGDDFVSVQTSPDLGDLFGDETSLNDLFSPQQPVGSYVSTGGGDDVIIGGEGADTLIGGSGNNLIEAGNNDFVYSLEGCDTVLLQGGQTTVQVETGDGSLFGDELYLARDWENGTVTAWTEFGQSPAVTLMAGTSDSVVQLIHGAFSQNVYVPAMAQYGV